MNFPYYNLVPKRPKANTAFRQMIAERGFDDPAFAAEQVEMCRQDPLYYFASYLFLNEPRPNVYWPAATLPFIPWSFQRDAIAKLCENLGKTDIVLEKTREMGATWMILAVLNWRWRFFPGESFLLVSRDEDMVDRPGDYKPLLRKLDFINEHMPAWMPPNKKNIRRLSMVMENRENGSTFTGEATTADVAVGGRETAVFCDEVALWKQGYKMMSALRGVTNCRIINSTHRGNDTAYAECVRKAKAGDMEYIGMHWSVHPHKAKGIWREGDTGRLRSPWYDKECRKCLNKAEIAAELDMDAYGSQTQFFDHDLLESVRATQCAKPWVLGEMDFDSVSMEFRGWKTIEDPKRARWSLWFNPDLSGRPPSRGHQYVFGMDISSGQGATNSILVVADCMTREKVAEFATPFLRPDQFADYAVAAALWFEGYVMGTRNTAFMCWEANGPGQIFGKRVLEIGYGNIYYREAEEKVTKNRTDIPGWWNTGSGSKSTLTILLGELQSALARGAYVERSFMALDEYGLYVHEQDGSIICSSSKVAAQKDPSGAGQNHADRVIATGLSYKAMQVQGETLQMAEAIETPYGSLAWRMKQKELAKPKEYNENWSLWEKEDAYNDWSREEAVA